MRDGSGGWGLPLTQVRCRRMGPILPGTPVLSCKRRVDKRLVPAGGVKKQQRSPQSDRNTGLGGSLLHPVANWDLPLNPQYIIVLVAVWDFAVIKTCLQRFYIVKRICHRGKPQLLLQKGQQFFLLCGLCFYFSLIGRSSCNPS